MKDNITENLSADVMSALDSAEVGAVIKTQEQLIQDKHQAWLKSRSGKITGSKFGLLIKQPRTKAEKEAGDLSQSSKTYLKDVVSELLGAVNRELDIYQFRWGHKYEPIAIEEFENKFDVEVTFKGDDQKCFNLNSYTGATPDGICGDYGIEVKCPENATHHLTHLLIEGQEELKKQKPDYYWQCVGGMLVTGLTKWKFISFYPFYEGDLKMKIIEIDRNDEDIQLLSKQLLKGKKYIDEILKKLNYVNKNQTN
ncbi:MAG: YqaJ viral recombinase family protein [Nitrosopumilus sp.]